MLFYQVQPIEDDETIVTNTAPPSVHSFENVSEKRLSIISSASAASTDGAAPMPMSLEPTINEPPSYENHHQPGIEFGTSPPPPYVGGGFLAPPELETEAGGDMLRPSSRSKTRPGSRDGGSVSEGSRPVAIQRRSKSEMAEKRSSWASLRLSNMTRGKSQDKVSIRKSGEWKREDYQGASARVSEDDGEGEVREKVGEKTKEKGKEKEREKSPKEKKDKGKWKEKDKDKEKSKVKKEVRECVIQ